MPSLINEMQRLMQSTLDDLRALPAEVSDDPAAAVLSLVMDFHRDVNIHVEGVPDSDGLIQQIRAANDRFRRAIRASAPNFRPYKRDKDKDRKHTMPDMTFLAEEDDALPTEPQPLPDLYEDDVSQMSKQ